MAGFGDIDALIVHSPLVGPTTTRALADALDRSRLDIHCAGSP